MDRPYSQLPPVRPTKLSSDAARSTEVEVVRRTLDEPDLPGAIGNDASQGGIYSMGARRQNQLAKKAISEILQDMLQMSLIEVLDLADDPAAPTGLRMAARRVVLALSDSAMDGSRADRAFDQVIDRTEGKPRIAVEVRAIQRTDPMVLLENLRAAHKRLPAPRDDDAPSDS